MNTAVEILYQDRRRIEQAVDDLERSLSPLWIDRVHGAIRALERLLTLHHRRESEVFFPRLAQRSEYARVATEALEREHRFEEDLLRSARTEFMVPEGETIDLGPLVQQCRFLVRSVRHHLRQEETLLLRPALAMLTDEEHRDLGAEMRSLRIEAA